MPIYEYKCEKCGHVFEDIVLSARDAGPSKCPKCSAPDVNRLISGTNFQLKGEGWFHSDYGKPKAATPSSSDSGTGSGGTTD